jgi:hypothetical protein
MAEVMSGLGFGGATFILDPLVAKSLKMDGFENKQQLADFIAKEAKPAPGPGGYRPRSPAGINFAVIGGEWNPVFMTADFTYLQTESIDRWIPKAGIRRTHPTVCPRRLSAARECADSIWPNCSRKR